MDNGGDVFGIDMSSSALCRPVNKNACVVKE